MVKTICLVSCVAAALLILLVSMYKPLSNSESKNFRAENEFTQVRTGSESFDATHENISWKNYSCFEKITRRRTVAILDTGISQRNLFNVVAERNFVKNNSEIAEDDNGHGTAMAGIIAADDPGYKSYSPGTPLFIAKVADSNGRVKLRHFNGGLRWAIQNKVDVINISIAMNSVNKETEKLLDDAKRQGILIVSSAGNPDNDGRDELPYPARMKGILSVGPSVGNHMFSPVVILSQGDANRKSDVFMPGIIVCLTNKPSLIKTSMGASPAVAAATGILARLDDREEVTAIKSIREYVIQPMIR